VGSNPTLTTNFKYITMRTFDVEVQETFARTITVKAEDEVDARDIVEDMYRSEEIVLDYSDFILVEFNSTDYD
jgi:hypothetical protein